MPRAILAWPLLGQASSLLELLAVQLPLACCQRPDEQEFCSPPRCRPAGAQSEVLRAPRHCRRRSRLRLRRKPPRHPGASTDAAGRQQGRRRRWRLLRRRRRRRWRRTRTRRTGPAPPPRRKARPKGAAPHTAPQRARAARHRSDRRCEGGDAQRRTNESRPAGSPPRHCGSQESHQPQLQLVRDACPPQCQLMVQ